MVVEAGMSRGICEKPPCHFIMVLSHVGRQSKLADLGFSSFLYNVLNTIMGTPPL